jgi:hypothetical protein
MPAEVHTGPSVMKSDPRMSGPPEMVDLTLWTVSIAGRPGDEALIRVARLDELRARRMIVVKGERCPGPLRHRVYALDNLANDDLCLALFQGIRRVASDCDGAVPPRPRQALTGDGRAPSTLERWLRDWVLVRHRDGAEHPADRHHRRCFCRANGRAHAHRVDRTLLDLERCVIRGLRPSCRGLRWPPSRDGPLGCPRNGRFWRA